MKHIRCRNLAVAVAGILSVGAVHAQSVKSQPGAKAEAPIPAITDWSSRSVIYHQPKMPDEFARNAAGDAELERRYRDPRYVAQVLRRLESEASRPAPQRNSSAMTSSKTSASAKCDERDRRRGHCTNEPSPDPGSAEGLAHRDWSNVLGNGDGGSGVLGMFPAKYNFDIAAAPSCANDFVVYGTNAAAASQGAGAAESRTSVMSAGNPAGSITIGSGSRSVTLTAAATATTNLQFANGGTDAQQAASLAAAVNVWSQQTGISANSNGGATVTYTRNGNGDTNEIAITSTLTNHTVGAVSSGTGVSGQPSIIAFNHLYDTTCPAGVNGRNNANAPNTMWAYNTGSGYVTETSPVLSYFDNGAQVAYLQRSGNTLQLVLLKWQAGQGTAYAPAAPTLSASANAYRTCISNCYYVMTLNGVSNTNNGATFSSPYVDYVSDTLWVGDGNSRLHKFNNVFRGDPAEETVGFPIPVSSTAGLDLSPPVSDGSAFVYVGTQSGAAGIGGMIHRVPFAGGTIANVVSSAKLTADNRSGVRAPMVLDITPTRGRLYSFVFSAPGTPTSTTLCEHQGGDYVYCRAIVQFNTASFTAGGTGTKREIGLGSITGEEMALWMGAFDDAFYQSSSGTGAMYFCGGSLPRTQRTTLWKVPFTNGDVGLPTIGAQIVEDDNETDDIIYQCSPPTYVKNGTNEYLYVSTGGAGRVFSNNPGCGVAADAASSCMYMFQLNNLDGDAIPNEAGDSTWGATNLPRTALGTNGATSGIVVDNISAATGASQVYYAQVAGTASNENWTLDFTGNVDNNNANTLVINDGGTIRTFTGNRASAAAPGYTCSATGNGSFYMNGTNENTEGAQLRACLTDAALTNFTIGGTGSETIITRNTTGDVADGLVTIGTWNADPQVSFIHVDGSSTSGNAIQASQSGLQ